jgi:Right handed beta helix region
MIKRLLWLLAAVAATLAVTGQAYGATLIVDDDGRASPPTNCGSSMPAHSSIEAAHESSPGADTVNVCPGTYIEQVSFESDDTGTTIRSLSVWAAIIKAPPTVATNLVDDKAIVHVNAATGIRILAFTITGPGPFNCDSLRYGVWVENGGSAAIERNHITEIRDNDPASLDPPFSGCQNGVGIQVGRTFVDGPTSGSATIIDNLLDRYQKNGMTVDNAGSNALIVGNRVHGIGPTPVIAQNGIQVSRGAVATVRGNQVQDHTYTLAPVFSSTGILLFEITAGTTISSNRAVRNDDNIAALTTSGTRILRNVLLDSTFFDGIYMGPDTSNNRIEENFLRGNAEHDCHDDSVGPNNPPALVANFWIRNDGITENREGLCQPQDEEECPDDDGDDDGLTDENELLLLTLLSNPDSDFDGVKDGNDDSNENGEDDEDEDDEDDDCPNDSDDDGTDDEDEDDD